MKITIKPTWGDEGPTIKEIARGIHELKASEVYVDAVDAGMLIANLEMYGVYARRLPRSAGVES